jgi:inosine-uridine nucleoside N-ribohydrolase
MIAGVPARRPSDAPIPIWLDCDPGHDDVVAILAAHRWAHLVGIGTVAGNARLERTTANALTIREMLDLDVPVHAGCERPLVVPPVWAPNIHGDSGLAGPVLPAITGTAAPGHAATALIDASRRFDAMWLVATGPLTNVALALRLDPTLVDRLAGIAVMGGGVDYGNTTPAAEFNLWADPDAAAIVMAAGAATDLRIVTLDVTHQILMGANDVAAIAATGGRHSAFFADMIAHFAEAYRDVFFDEAVGPIHDPCAVLAVTHPELFSFVRWHVVADRSSGPSRGALVVDRRGVKGGQAPNASVATAVRAEEVHRMLMDVVLAACA